MESVTKELQRVGKKHPLLLIKIFEEVNLTKTEIQQVINRFEQTVLPFMDSQGRIDGVSLKNKLPVKWANIIPDNKFRMVDVCSDVLPIIQYVKGVFVK